MNENKRWYLYLAALVIGIAFCLWYIFGQNVPDSRSGADAVRNELNAAGAAIDSASGRIDAIEAGFNRSEQAIDNSQERIESIKERAENIERGLAESLHLNRESQFIIQRVRERGTADAKKID